MQPVPKFDIMVRAERFFMGDQPTIEVRPKSGTNGSNHVLEKPHTLESGLTEANLAIFNNPGLVPSMEPVRIISSQTKIGYGGQEQTIDTNNNATRPLYHEGVDSLKSFAREGVYNSTLGPDRRPINLNLFSTEGLKPVLKRILERLREGDVKVLLPFANEAGTIGKDTRYASSRVGLKNVLPIDAGVQPEATIEARSTGAEVVNQHEVLKHVKWDLLKEKGIIPPHFPIPPKGLKGLTLYAGYLRLEADRETREDDFVIQHDTDIANPGSDNRDVPNLPSDYGALEHLGLSLAYPLPNQEASYIARTGEGRNNEAWTFTANQIANFSVSEKVKEAGLRLSRIIWPLTGERGYRWKTLRAFPRATGMGTETTDNFCIAGKSTQQKDISIAQVADPSQKIENRINPRDRDFVTIFMCSRWLDLMARHSDEINRLPHEWTLEDIGAFNARWGGREQIFAVPPREDSHPNTYISVKSDFMLPSMQQLQELDVVNWEAIRLLNK